jgi:ATP-binding cassette subfamily B (MDR/TAP) protein 1
LELSVSIRVDPRWTSIYGAYGLAFFYGGILVAQGHANVGIVINVFMSILIGSFSMAMLTPELQAVTKARGAAAKLFATIDRVPLIDSSDPGGFKPDTVQGTISFENVKFHYPSRPNVPILKGLSTTFPAGQTIALVGSSGSGKSTVVSLVERFYDPISGVIKLDGRDVKSLNLKWLRQQIGEDEFRYIDSALTCIRSCIPGTHSVWDFCARQRRAWSDWLAMGARDGC